jgi:hypothetical protein
MFKELVMGKYVLAVVNSSDGLQNLLEIDLWVDGKDVGQLLLDAGLATKVDTALGEAKSILPG